MKLTDNTDTTILVYCDWLEDNNQYQLSQDLRQELIEEEDSWEYQYKRGKFRGCGGFDGFGVGSVGIGGIGGVSGIKGIGSICFGSIGSFAKVGGFGNNGIHVGV